MVSEIRSLPLENRELFFSDSRNIWTAESCLRRGLEALFDLGRHILARGFGSGVTEYKEIASLLAKEGVLAEEEAALLKILAGYRNRMVHFYHEIEPEELFEVCSNNLSDLEVIASAFTRWLEKNSHLLDEQL
jgi:uncharacterized protein YutE (UPF0331/DUF86 family)